MSYKIEITASSTSELAGKLLALAATMQTLPSDPVMPEVREAAKPAKKAKPAPVQEEVAEDVGNEPKSAADAEITESPQTTTELSSTPAPAASVSEPEQAPGAKALDFDKDIAPLVLKVVAEKGKPVVQEILTQFGVERASQVPDEQLNELVSALQDAL